MFQVILDDLRRKKYKQVLLWVVFRRAIKSGSLYEKHGFKRIGSFWHDGKDNHDIVLDL